MRQYEFKFKTKLWVYEGPNPWYFVTVPQIHAKYIREEFRNYHRGWGSIPVKVTIGKSSWQTSIFWEKRGTYLLPVKKEIRENEKLQVNKDVEISIATKA